MINYPFRNQAEFNEIFGLRTTGDGKLVRRNKILLAMIKNRECHKTFSWLKDTKTTSKIFEYLLRDLSNKSCECDCDKNVAILVNGNFYRFYNTDYNMDERGGICEDCDTTSYRYIKDGRIYKMKIGKLFSKVLADNSHWTILPEQVKVFFLEEITKEWKSQNEDLGNRYTLCVNKRFDSIYSSRCCLGDFHSCMTGKGRESFYEKCIKAHAAYIRDAVNNDLIVARCVIYDEVFGYGENPLRLAERQYSHSGRDFLKSILIQKLIAGGYIDGYKKIGVDCHANNAFLLNDGTDISDAKLWIENTLDPCSDVLSYQDSFIHYDSYNNRAYNYPERECDFELDTTDEYLDAAYDDYHNECCRDVVEVYYHGDRITCNEDRLEDFTYIDEFDGYYHYDDYYTCPRCDRYYLDSRYYDFDCGYYSELTGEDYCCEDCLLEAEEDYKRENWYYSSYDDEYYEDDEYVIDVNVWNERTKSYDLGTIYSETLYKTDHLMYDCKYYIGYDEETQKPYGYENENK